MTTSTASPHVVLGVVVRMMFTALGLAIDSWSRLRYTDIDYTVYRAAALNVYRALAAMLTGTEALLPTSPYAVPTYRYSPLLALVLTPIAALDVYGKLLFSAADAATGVVLASLLREMKLPAQYCSTVAFLWAVNPFSTIIATRGSSDAISNLLFLCVLLLLMRRRLVLAGVVYGFLVHFRLFHIVYSAALALSVLRGGPRAPALRALRWLSYKPDLKLVSKFVKALDLRGCFTFALAAVATFATLFAACFAVYGQDYLNNSILFHFTRLDFRHNFSPMFLPMYLSHGPVLLRYATFVPQALLVLLTSLLFGWPEHLPTCALLITLIFVAFNKVITAQYFTWYLCLLPVVMHRLRFPLRVGVALAVTWLGAMSVWLLAAYLLEFEGQDAFLAVWACAALFHVANAAVIVAVLACAV